ncbi:hypothetical protein PAXRUDRAFT_822146 [Paxillus rubicundulus Ve08.2h10]|uniref:Uncharacterized protein n=1 Tax=Paxillus rubicundulus Ve08.2h10 TaxID=930991 RepID=A0A0D0DML3_9AGAM|nr:hypothetical protein PAXRUDRAFT_822146 [Paxillus rubicundulus Ve08.2h10]
MKGVHLGRKMSMHGLECARFRTPCQLPAAQVAISRPLRHSTSSPEETPSTAMPCLVLVLCLPYLRAWRKLPSHHQPNSIKPSFHRPDHNSRSHRINIAQNRQGQGSLNKGACDMNQ